jgi:hypothetical protein
MSEPCSWEAERATDLNDERKSLLGSSDPIGAHPRRDALGHVLLFNVTGRTPGLRVVRSYGCGSEILGGGGGGVG